MSNSSRSISLRISLIAAAVALAAHAQAADETDMWYVNPQAGYTLLDSSRNIDDDFHYGFGFGYHATRNFSLEFNGLFGDFGDVGTLHQNAYSIDGLFVFNRESNISPYVSLGAGYIENNFGSSDTLRGTLGQVGVGVMLDAGDGNFVFQFRPEVKYRHDWPNSPHGESDAGDILINLGFVFNFGADRSSPPPVAQHAAATSHPRRRPRLRRRWIPTATAFPTTPIVARARRAARSSMKRVVRGSR